MSSPEGIPKGRGQLALRNLPELGKLAADVFFPPVAQQFFIAVVFVNPDQVSDDLPIIQFLSLLQGFRRKVQLEPLGRTV